MPHEKPLDLSTSGDAIPGLLGTDFRKPAESQKSRDWLAVLGGCSERVSAVKFPDPRENTGNFR